VDGAGRHRRESSTIRRVDIEVLSTAELTAMAGSRAKARLLVRDVDWCRVCRDAYVRREVEDDQHTRLAALHKVLPAHVAVSHRAALWLFGLDVASAVLDVTAPRGLHVDRRAGIRPHSALLPDHELCMVGDLLVVTPARAVIDVARDERLVESVVVGDAVLRSGLATMEGIAAVVEGSAGLRHVERARAVLPHLEPRTESPMESRYRMLLVLGGLPRPDAQFDVYDLGGHVARTDFHLEGVVLEYDGRKERLEKAKFTGDRSRQNRLADTGLEIRRFTSYDYYGRPHAAVCADVRRAVLVARGRDRSRVLTGPDTLPKPRRVPPATLADAAVAAAATAA
jgi:hypothetical protein